jgi:hypothetical protein
MYSQSSDWGFKALEACAVTHAAFVEYVSGTNRNHRKMFRA